MATLPLARIGTSNAERLGTIGMTAGTDRLSASGGNDELVYELSSAGGADSYYGGTGVDTLELRFTAAEWAIHSTKVLAMQKLIADAPKPTAGAVAAGTNFGKLDFGSGKTLQVFEVETVKIYIDGVEYTGVTPPTNSAVSITSAAQSGAVVENGALTAAGTISFTDADLADVHTVSFAPVAGALGSFTLSNVSEAANTAAGSVNWTYNLNNASAAVQALAQGQTVTETYTVSVSDGHGSTQAQAVTVTITGTNDAPVITSSAAAAAGAVVESGTAASGAAIPGTAIATGQLTSSDVDAGASAVWIVAGATAGDYGNFSITEQGKWTYLLDNSLADSLVSGAVVTETFTARVTDDKGASVDKVITIQITGSEDAVLIAVTNEGEVTEAGDDVSGPASAQGRMVDVEVPANAVWSVFGTPSDMYGTFSIAENGVWVYTLDNADAETNLLLDGDVRTENFSIVATFTVNGVEQTVEREVDITIHGTNDAAVITVVGDEDLEVVEAGGVLNAIDDDAGASGSLHATDPDGSQLFTQASVDGLYGTLNITEAGDWGYTLDNEKAEVQALKAGQHVQDHLTVTAADGTERVITINITGADDAASMVFVDTFADIITDVLGNKSPDGTGEEYYDNTVVEAGGMKNGTDTNALASGMFELADPDGGALTFHALDSVANPDFVGSVSKGEFGDFTLNTTTGAWTYKLRNNDVNVQALTATDAKTDSLTVYSADGTSAQTVTVNITGAEDLTASITQDMATAIVLVSEQYETKDADGNTVVNAARTAAGGTLTVNDFDTALVDQTPYFETPALAKLKGKYGDFTLTDAQDGTGTATWTYAVNTDVDGTDNDINTTADNYKSIESLKAGQIDTEVLVVKSLDGGASYAVTVSVKGYNDAAVLKEEAYTDPNTGLLIEAPFKNAAGEVVVADHDITEDGGVNNADKADTQVGGIAVAYDVDTGESGWLAPATAALTGTYGKFTFNTATGAWGYTLNNSALNVQQLRAGDEATDTLYLKSKDGTVIPLSVTINGANDEGAITVKPGTTPDLSVKEAGGASNNTVGKAVAGGFLVVTDVDGSGDTAEAVFSNDTFSVGSSVGTGVLAAPAVTSLANAERDSGTNNSIHGTYGDFTFDILTGKWGYTLNEGKADVLKVNQKAIDSLVVFSGDASVSYQVSVNILGANDSASIRPDLAAVQDTVAQAGGKMAAVAGTAAGQASDATDDAVGAGYKINASGKLIGGDPDDAGAPVAFKAPVASALAGKYGFFRFVPADGTWDYQLNENDADTRALRIGDAAAQDKLTVAAVDGSVYTITVNVKGANNEVDLKAGADIKVNPAGNLTYTVVDGDTGSALKMLVTGADDIARVYGATTVLDGSQSTLSIPAAAGTNVVAGTLSVTDGFTGHSAEALNAYLALGTNADNTLDASTSVTATNGALMAGYAGDDTMTGTDANDYMSGGNDDDLMYGLAGNDKLDGGTGNDTMDGGAGNDNLVGGAGVDYLLGDVGADRLEGGLGKDVLAGGAAADTFVFVSKANDMGATNFDVITDFSGFGADGDHIESSKALLGTSGNTAAKIAVGAWFYQGTAAHNATDRFIYDSVTGNLWYDADGTGAVAKIKVAVLDDGAGNHAALTAGDFTWVA